MEENHANYNQITNLNNTILFIISIYSNRYTGHQRGITSLQRMGVGLFISILAMTVAALTEKRRRDDANPSAMSVFWLFPQFFLLGTF